MSEDKLTAEILFDPVAKMNFFKEAETEEPINVILKMANDKLLELVKDDEDKNFHNNLEKYNMFIERSLSAFQDFYYQCWNNGLQGWFINGYCTDIQEVIKCVQMLETKESEELLVILKDFETHIDPDKENVGCFGNYIIKSECWSCDNGYITEEIENPEYCYTCQGYEGDCEECGGNGSDEEFDICESICEECDGNGEYEDTSFYESAEVDCWRLLEIVRKQLNKQLSK